jgi:hypothetical protein
VGLGATARTTTGRWPGTARRAQLLANKYRAESKMLEGEITFELDHAVILSR